MSTASYARHVHQLDQADLDRLGRATDAAASSSKSLSRSGISVPGRVSRSRRAARGTRGARRCRVDRRSGGPSSLLRPGGDRLRARLRPVRAARVPAEQPYAVARGGFHRGVRRRGRALLVGSRAAPSWRRQRSRQAPRATSGRLIVGPRGAVRPGVASSRHSLQPPMFHRRPCARLERAFPVSGWPPGPAPTPRLHAVGAGSPGTSPGPRPLLLGTGPSRSMVAYHDDEWGGAHSQRRRAVRAAHVGGRAGRAELAHHPDGSTTATAPRSRGLTLTPWRASPETDVDRRSWRPRRSCATEGKIASTVANARALATEVQAERRELRRVRLPSFVDGTPIVGESDDLDDAPGRHRRGDRAQQGPEASRVPVRGAPPRCTRSCRPPGSSTTTWSGASGTRPEPARDRRSWPSPRSSPASRVVGAEVAPHVVDGDGHTRAVGRSGADPRRQRRQQAFEGVTGARSAARSASAGAPTAPAALPSRGEPAPAPRRWQWCPQGRQQTRNCDGRAAARLQAGRELRGEWCGDALAGLDGLEEHLGDVLDLDVLVAALSFTPSSIIT